MHANFHDPAASAFPGEAATAAQPVTESARRQGERLQIPMSPYYGRPDFTALRHGAKRRLDRVSIADLLRNGFVYPPHSVYEDVKVVTFGFNPLQDMHDRPEFHYRFRDAHKNQQPRRDSLDWVGEYHRLLCGALARSCHDIASPWLLQSGGKDSTPLAIAASEVRPETTCITYLGGREEDEVASASFVARKLGLRHETLTCNPARAYDRYLAIVADMPLLTADFALLSYVDLVSEIAASGGDGVIDGMGSDSYFGLSVDRTHRLLSNLARGWKLPAFLSRLPIVERNFPLCYVLATLQMERVERTFPGSRFTDQEVDELFGRALAARSRQRLELYKDELASAQSIDEWFAIAMSVSGSAGGFAKGLLSSSALSVQPGVSVLRRRTARLGLPRGPTRTAGGSDNPCKQGAGAGPHRDAVRPAAVRDAQGQLPLRPAWTRPQPFRSRLRVEPAEFGMYFPVPCSGSNTIATGSTTSTTPRSSTCSRS